MLRRGLKETPKRVSRFYYFEILGTAVFAITGVLAVTRRGLDVFGALVLGVVTALGGGTVRDVIIRVPVLWIEDFNYVWAAAIGALAAFWIGSLFRSTYRTLLYLDALGAALFAVIAADRRSSPTSADRWRSSWACSPPSAAG